MIRLISHLIQRSEKLLKTAKGHDSRIDVCDKLVLLHYIDPLKSIPDDRNTKKGFPICHRLGWTNLDRDYYFIKKYSISSCMIKFHSNSCR